MKANDLPIICSENFKSGVSGWELTPASSVELHGECSVVQSPEEVMEWLKVKVEETALTSLAVRPLCPE